MPIFPPPRPTPSHSHHLLHSLRSNTEIDPLTHTHCLQEEMEALLGKACKQAMASLASIREALGNPAARKVVAAPMTRMLCPQLGAKLESVLFALDLLPGLIERTLQNGRDNDFFFEVSTAGLVS